MKDNIIYDITRTKYITSKYKELLIATNNAELWHVVPRSKPVRFLHLEELRKRI